MTAPDAVEPLDAFVPSATVVVTVAPAVILVDAGTNVSDANVLGFAAEVRFVMANTTVASSKQVTAVRDILIERFMLLLLIASD